MTFTATMKANTTRSGMMGMRRVRAKIFDRTLPVSSAWALVSSRMMRKRIREATAAAPKAPAKNVDVTVTTVVIIGRPLGGVDDDATGSYLKPWSESIVCRLFYGKRGKCG